MSSDKDLEVLRRKVQVQEIIRNYQSRSSYPELNFGGETVKLTWSEGSYDTGTYAGVDNNHSYFPESALVELIEKHLQSGEPVSSSVSAINVYEKSQKNYEQGPGTDEESSGSCIQSIPISIDKDHVLSFR
jgi:hypothetical protein